MCCMYKIWCVLIPLFLLTGCGGTQEISEDINLETTRICNMLNGSFVTQGRENEFFYCDYDSTKDTFHILINKGEASEVLIENSNHCYFYQDNWLYYRAVPDLSLHRMEIDTREDEQLFSENCSEVILFDDILYCTVSNTLYAVQLSDGSSALISENGAHNLFVSQNQLYCQIENTIYKMENDEFTVIFSTGEKELDGFIILNNMICFSIYPEGLYIVKIGEQESRQVAEGEVTGINVRNDEVIFSCIGSSGISTFSFLISEDDLKKLSNRGGNGICIANNIIFSYEVSSLGDGIIRLDTNEFITSES